MRIARTLLSRNGEGPKDEVPTHSRCTARFHQSNPKPHHGHPWHSAYSILTQGIPHLSYGFVESWLSSRIATSETIPKKFGGLLDRCYIFRGKINDLRRVQGIRFRIHASAFLHVFSAASGRGDAVAD